MLVAVSNGAYAKPDLGETKIVLSYYWPESKKTKELRSVSRLVSATHIDILASHAKNERNMYHGWASRGARFVTRKYPFKGFRYPGRIPVQLKTSDAILKNLLSGEILDGAISLDEIVGGGNGNVVTEHQKKILIKALREFKALRPKVKIYAWISKKWTPSNRELLVKLAQQLDFLIPQIYIKASASSRNTNQIIKNVVRDFEILVPRISEKLIIGLGSFAEMDDVEAVDLGSHLTKQIRGIAEDPALAALPGIAIYAPIYTSPADLEKINEAVSNSYLAEKR